MSRRAPPREYYEEDFEIERERDRYSRPRRKDRDFEEEEEDVEIRRRRSIPPVEELERLDIRERPPRDFMRESYEPPRERGPLVMRRSRDEVDDIPRGTELDEKYRRPPRERRRYRPREIDEEELVLDARDMRGDRRRRSERDLVEDDVVIRHRERAPRREYDSEGEFGPRRRLDDERDDIYVRRTVPRRRSRYSEEEIEELLVDESEMERPHPQKSRDDPQFDRRKSFEAFVLDDSGPELPRRRRSHGDREVEEERIIDEREGERSQGRRSQARPRRKEEIVMKWKDRPSPDEVDEDEIHFRETRRHRRSPPDPRLSREPPGAWPSDREGQGPDEEIRIRSRMRSRPRHAADDEEDIIIRRQERERRRRAEESELVLIRDDRERDRRRAFEDDEELIIRHKDRDRRRASLEDDEIMLRKTKRRSPPRDHSPSLKSIHAPPIHQDIITHHRHIDHGFDRPPRAPSPEIPSTRTSFDEADVHHREKDGHISEEDIIFKHRDEDESVTPTSGPSLGFNDPWEADRMTSRRKPKSLIDESESVAAGSSHSRPRWKASRGFDLDAGEEDDVEEAEEEVVVHETRSVPRSRDRSPIAEPRVAPDEWSMVHTPVKDEAVEMSGALKVIEVAPKRAIDDEIDRDRVGAQVSKERRDERWTEITKDLVVREAIERLGYEFEETRLFYYIFSFMEPGDIDELVELSDEIRQARRRRIREMHRERATLPPRPRPLVDRMPPRPRMAGERRVREREWIINARR